MTEDLTTRLLAAIEETEKIARAADDGPWRLERETRDVTDYWTVVTDRDFLMSDSDSADSPNAHHIVRQDPKSTLRHCAAHRKIVHLYEIGVDALTVAEGTILAGACKVRLGAYENALKALAEGYGLTAEPAP